MTVTYIINTIDATSTSMKVLTRRVTGRRFLNEDAVFHSELTILDVALSKRLIVYGVPLYCQGEGKLARLHNLKVGCLVARCSTQVGTTNTVRRSSSNCDAHQAPGKYVLFSVEYYLSERKHTQSFALSVLSDSRLGIDASYYLKLLTDNPPSREPLLAATGGLPLALTTRIESDLRTLEKLRINLCSFFLACCRASDGSNTNITWSTMMRVGTGGMLGQNTRLAR
ncbi:hypothetical protein BDR07DRAFT_1520839, partial [Suillus spraguei]